MLWRESWAALWINVGWDRATQIKSEMPNSAAKLAWSACVVWIRLTEFRLATINRAMLLLSHIRFLWLLLRLPSSEVINCLISRILGGDAISTNCFGSDPIFSFRFWLMLRFLFITKLLTAKYPPCLASLFFYWHACSLNSPIILFWGIEGLTLAVVV